MIKTYRGISCLLVVLSWTLPKETYGPAARKAWLGLVKHIDENGNVADVCEGTNKGFSVQYYMDRKRLTGAAWTGGIALERDGVVKIAVILS